VHPGAIAEAELLLTLAIEADTEDILSESELSARSCVVVGLVLPESVSAGGANVIVCEGASCAKTLAAELDKRSAR